MLRVRPKTYIGSGNLKHAYFFFLGLIFLPLLFLFKLLVHVLFNISGVWRSRQNICPTVIWYHCEHLGFLLLSHFLENWLKMIEIIMKWCKSQIYLFIIYMFTLTPFTHRKYIKKKERILVYLKKNMYVWMSFFTEDLLFGKHGDLFSFKKRPFQSKSEIYEQSLGKSVQIFRLKRDNNWTDEDFEMTCR